MLRISRDNGELKAEYNGRQVVLQGTTAIIDGHLYPVPIYYPVPVKSMNEAIEIIAPGIDSIEVIIAWSNAMEEK